MKKTLLLFVFVLCGCAAPGVKTHDENQSDAANAMKFSYEKARVMVEDERDRVIFTRNVSIDEIKLVDKNRKLAEELAKNGAFEEAWVMLKYAYSGYQSLANQAAAREMLDEAERDGASKELRKEQLGDYTRGLRAYLAKDMEGTLHYLMGYIESGDKTYSEKARSIAIAASLQSGIEKYRKGDSSGAGNAWYQGLKIDPEQKDLKRSVEEFIMPKCNERFNTGMMAYSKGEFKRAEKLWRECIEMYPGYERAQRALQRLK